MLNTWWLAAPLFVLTLGSLVYQGLAIYCVWRFYQKRKAPTHNSEPISILKPLHGAEVGLEVFLESFFVQDFASYEIIFAVRHADDPAVAVVSRLCERYSHIHTKFIFTGEPPYANAKVYSLEKMSEVASYNLLVITDSDTEVPPDYLTSVAQAFAQPEIGVLTHLYRGIANDEFWAKLEALGMSTEFMAGVIVAEKLEGMKFALGPSMAIRKQCLADIGGFAAMRDYLADDFVLGHWAESAGWQVVLPNYIVAHHVSTTGFWPTFQHRLRWNRSTRFSRPVGYLGQGFTYALSWALVFLISFPGKLSAGMLAVTLFLRITLALTLGKGVLGDSTVLRRIWWLPAQDLLSFASWWGGWLSREIIWRGERYRLLAGGKFEPVIPRVK